MDKKHIWAIGGGKGGSGKSLVAANLGIQLAEAGYKVIILDFDWGGGNLHTYLGLSTLRKTMGDYVLNRVANLSDVCIDTAVPNLRIICAPQDFYPFSGLFSQQKTKILKHISALKGDFIILDLGPGSAYSILDLSLISNCSILVTLPEPSAIENSYLFMKRLIHRRIAQIIRPQNKIHLLTRWTIERNGNENRDKHIGEFLSYLRQVDSSLGKQVEAALAKINVKVILNQVRTQEDVQVGNAISYLARKFIGLDVEYTGFIPFDNSVNIAARKLRPFTIYYSESKAAKGLSSVARRLLA
jgi:flagellar biosynthesis protein FlhG